MTMTSARQQVHRRRFARDYYRRMGQAMHKRRVANAMGLDGASKEQLRTVADLAWTEWQLREGSLKRTKPDSSSD